MLIEFTVKNFRSIREAQTLSLVKGKSNEFQATHSFQPPSPGALPLLRSCAIYGPNAAGKSNFIKGLGVMRSFVVESATAKQLGDEIPVTPFLFDDQDAKCPTDFEIVFINEGVRYQYGFSATVERVWDEWLLAYPKGRPQRWFRRVYDADTETYNWEMGSGLAGKKHLWQESTRANALFVSTAVQLNSEQLKPVYDWFREKLRITNIRGWSPAVTASLYSEIQFKSDINEFLRAADLEIQDVNINTKKFDSGDLPDDMPDVLKLELISELKGAEVFDIKTIHQKNGGGTCQLEFDEESDGTQKLFSFAGPWLDSLANGYVLVIDELHDNFHPAIVRFLVSLFHNTEKNPENAQLVFTTHETSILSQDVFRRDQIWFCEKDQYQATSLYSLSDFSVRKKHENLERSYLSGRYGALPFIRNLKTG